MAQPDVSFQPEATAQLQACKEEAASAEPSTLDCVICFTPYDQLFRLPKELSCGHIFCLECLARINVSSEDVNALTCPVCRAPTTFPSCKGLPGLPTRSDLLDQLSSAPIPPGSVRFDRRRGLLYLPGRGRGGAQAGPKPGSPLNTVSLSIDVGRPAPQGASRVLGLSGWPFYVALAVALLVTIGLITCGIYIFLMPSMYTVSMGGRPQGNHSIGSGANRSYVHLLPP
ncbi:RING finger protein 225-like [Rhineura floridana]|uniref:RING finger protein 225-like n=1 Tax=Rhineura floridana TaxID=261503 RepID=UPI002AC7F29A|nr:RING finger protein 225-like [Rhineura floridana]XP_061474957.1 RING finger protein 225-like [Rhineura floridana]XP_061474958.1 RING finger protein 225-like [Rhineura floridana]